MSNLRIKQISNSGAPGGSVIAFDGSANVWQKINHTQGFSSGDLDEEGFLLVDHEIGRKYVNVTIYDADDEMVIPDSVKAISESQVRIGLRSFSQGLLEWIVVVS